MTGARLTSLALVGVLSVALVGCATGPADDWATNSTDRVSVVALSSAHPAANPTAFAEPSATAGQATLDAATDLAASGLPFIRNQPHRVAPFPLVLNDVVKRYVEAYANHSEGIEGSFRRSRPYLPAMVKVFEERGLPPELVYLSFAESRFKSKGAGPWQLSRATARRYHLIVNRYIDERRDPIKSTRAAAEYLAALHDEAGDWNMALVGWNRGEKALDRYWSLRGVKYGQLTAHLPYNTRSLLNRFMAVAIIAHQPERYGIQPVDYSEPVHFRTLRIKGGTTLAHVARRTGVPVSELRQLNPALLHDRVPASIRSYELRLPLAESADAGSMLRF
ncbi:MAG TPA: transglycosylase SLT domain-containing protein [Candidatus Binataceae bacterium]|jgi:membrane-bound lytic murein transglycosylase D|nr:transglycosylase SLT domain-containing protein [Candidatus Binataceae bacterium]